MIRLIIAAVFAMALGTEAMALPSECYEIRKYYTYESAEAFSKGNAQNCWRALEQLEIDFSAMVANAYRVGEKPIEVVQLPKWSLLREDSDVLLQLKSIRYDLLGKIGENVADSLRSLYSNSAVLMATFDKISPTLRSLFENAGVRGLVQETLASNRAVVEKPVTISIGRDATKWYLSHCGTDDATESDCNRIASFPAQFKEYYGVEPTRDNAVIVGFLHRRRLEGGPELVGAWQKIGKDLIELLK